jgi:hypothetical protein
MMALLQPKHVYGQWTYLRNKVHLWNDNRRYVLLKAFRYLTPCAVLRTALHIYQFWRKLLAPRHYAKMTGNGQTHIIYGLSLFKATFSKHGVRNPKYTTAPLPIQKNLPTSLRWGSSKFLRPCVPAYFAYTIKCSSSHGGVSVVPPKNLWPFRVQIISDRIAVGYYCPFVIATFFLLKEFRILRSLRCVCPGQLACVCVHPELGPCFPFPVSTLEFIQDRRHRGMPHRHSASARPPQYYACALLERKYCVSYWPGWECWSPISILIH